MITRNETGAHRGFLLMPFCQDLEWLRDEIVRAGREVNVEIERADDISLPGVILEQVFEAIRKADVVIAVCTGHNANVFFELGYAWHTHKAVLVAETEVDLPFDVQHLRTEFYGKPNSGQDRRTLRVRVANAVKASILNEGDSTLRSQTQSRDVDDVRERLNNKIHHVQEEMKESNLPAIYVVVEPMQQYERIFYPANTAIRRIRDVNHPPVFSIEEAGNVVFRHLQPSFKKIEFDTVQDGRSRGFDWMEFYDDASFLGVLTGHENLQVGIFEPNTPASGGRGIGGFYDVRVTCQLVARLMSFSLLADLFGIGGDLRIHSGIANVALPVTITTGPERTGVHNTRLVTEPIQTEVSVKAEDLTSVLGVLRCAVGLLNDLMMAFGWPRCFQLEVDGTVVLNTWGRSWSTNVERWTRANDIPVIDSYST